MTLLGFFFCFREIYFLLFTCSPLQHTLVGEDISAHGPSDKDIDCPTKFQNTLVFAVSWLESFSFFFSMCGKLPLSAEVVVFKEALLNQ